MNETDGAARRRFLGRMIAAFGAFGVAGCDRLSQTDWFPKVLGSAEHLNDRVATLITGRKAMAQEFTPPTSRRPFAATARPIPTIRSTRRSPRIISSITRWS